MMKEKQQIEEMAKVLKDYTKKNNIMASHVILDDYAEELYKAGFSKQEWISVNERLPEENGRYLVFIKVSHQLFENLNAVGLINYNKNDGFILYSITETVTHWMPLPEAPKMKDTEN